MTIPDKKFYNSLEFYCYIGKHYWGNETLNFSEHKACEECLKKDFKNLWKKRSLLGN